MKLRIGGAEFKSMQIAKKYAINVISEYVGRQITSSCEHWGFVCALWQRSPSFVPGVIYFEVTPKFGGCATRAITCEGQIDFSIRSAISGKDVNRWTKLTIALRGSIRPQTQQFRANAHHLCELCGSEGHLEVDHVVSFKSLMRGYLEQVGRYPDEYAYAHSGWTFTSKDRVFEEGWRQYHQDSCQLRMLCEGCHSRVTLEARMQRPMIRYFGDSDSP